MEGGPDVFRVWSKATEMMSSCSVTSEAASATADSLLFLGSDSAGLSGLTWHTLVWSHAHFLSCCATVLFPGALPSQVTAPILLSPGQLCSLGWSPCSFPWKIPAHLCPLSSCPGQRCCSRPACCLKDSSAENISLSVTLPPTPFLTDAKSWTHTDIEKFWVSEGIAGNADLWFADCTQTEEVRWENEQNWANHQILQHFLPSQARQVYMDHKTPLHVVLFLFSQKQIASLDTFEEKFWFQPKNSNLF